MHDCWPYFGFESCTSITLYYTRCCLLLNSGEACKQKTLMDVKGLQKIKIKKLFMKMWAIKNVKILNDKSN